MAVVVTFEDFVPPSRYDGIPWTRARVEEGPSVDGPWTQIDLQNLTAVDTDPANPKARSLTVQTATLEQGWYRLTFLDATGNFVYVDPIHNIKDAGPEFMPTLHQLGSLLRARTVDANSREQGTFTDTTRPTNIEAVELARQAAEDLATAVGNNIPDALVDTARRLAAIRAAMLIELSYFPEQVAVNRSPYAQYKDLWDEAVGRPGRPGTFVVAVEGAMDDQTVDVEEGAGMPYFGFPVDTIVGFDTIM